MLDIKYVDQETLDDIKATLCSEQKGYTSNTDPLRRKFSGDITEIYRFKGQYYSLEEA